MLKSYLNLTLYSHCCKPIDRVYIMNEESISFDVANIVHTPGVTNLVMAHVASSLSPAVFPQFLSHSVESERVEFTITPDSSMNAGDHVTIKIEATCEETTVGSALPPEKSLIGQMITEVFDLDIYSYEGSFKVEN